MSREMDGMDYPGRIGSWLDAMYDLPFPSRFLPSASETYSTSPQIHLNPEISNKILR